MKYAVLFLAAAVAIGGVSLVYTKSNFQKRFNQSKALSCLREWQVAQCVYEQMNPGSNRNRYAQRMIELYDAPDAQPRRLYLIDKDLADAWDGNDRPVALGGYLFADIAPDIPSAQIGLCAYPEKPGESGDAMLILLIDDTKLSMTKEGRPAQSGNEIRIYATLYNNIGAPLRTWPGEEELETNFIRIDRGLMSTDDLRKLIDETKKAAE
jgi:hypothetical protein